MAEIVTAMVEVSPGYGGSAAGSPEDAAASYAAFFGYVDGFRRQAPGSVYAYHFNLTQRLWSDRMTKVIDFVPPMPPGNVSYPGHGSELPCIFVPYFEPRTVTTATGTWEMEHSCTKEAIANMHKAWRSFINHLNPGWGSDTIGVITDTGTLKKEKVESYPSPKLVNLTNEYWCEFDNVGQSTTALGLAAAYALQGAKSALRR